MKSIRILPGLGIHGVATRLLLLWSLFSLIRGTASGPDPTNDLIAIYPLRADGNDALGKNPPFVLTNTPFFQGAVYVNGLYEPNGHFVNYLSNAPVKGLRYDSFTISLDFCPHPQLLKRKIYTRPEAFLNRVSRGLYENLTGAHEYQFDQRNILAGGQHYRWMGLNREENRLNLTLNNQEFTYRFKDTVVHPNRWHNLVCSVDLENRRIITFFDGKMLETISLPRDFKLDVLAAPDRELDGEREFSFVNYSNGSVYRGYAGNLKIFGRALTESEIALLDHSSFAGLPTFPSDRGYSVALLVTLLVFAGLVILFVNRRLRRRQSRQSASGGNVAAPVPH